MTYEIERAEANAPRMTHMTDADIRYAIADEAEALSGPMGYGVGIGALDAEGEARIRIAEYRAELRRRACALYDLRMLTGVQMIALKHVAMGREQVAAYRPIFDELCALGLMTEVAGQYRLKSIAAVILDSSADSPSDIIPAVPALVAAE